MLISWSNICKVINNCIYYYSSTKHGLPFGQMDTRKPLLSQKIMIAEQVEMSIHSWESLLHRDQDSEVRVTTKLWLAEKCSRLKMVRISERFTRMNQLGREDAEVKGRKNETSRTRDLKKGPAFGTVPQKKNSNLPKGWKCSKTVMLSQWDWRDKQAGMASWNWDMKKDHSHWQHTWDGKRSRLDIELFSLAPKVSCWWENLSYTVMWIGLIQKDGIKYPQPQKSEDWRCSGKKIFCNQKCIYREHLRMPFSPYFPVGRTWNVFWFYHY